jgi:hypothetical protein
MAAPPVINVQPNNPMTPTDLSTGKP